MANESAVPSLISRIVSGVRPAWPDEARYVIQAPVFRRVLGQLPFRGAILNAGCGEGLFSPLLDGFSEVTRVVNCDLAPSREILKRSGKPHSAVSASLVNLPFSTSAFDGVLCSEVLEHIEDDHQAARELGRVTKPGGTLLVSVPTPPAPPDENHVREGYDLAALSALLGQAGFVIEAHELCFHGFMRFLFPVWRWQYRVLGRNLAPRAAILALAQAELRWRLGKPWDLVVVARRV